ncbi:MAG TPA: hypothetical protein PK971_13435, partial [Saprospiraceae bacterium]|nr:hypothetical protein [Saprospiraceae bacterium]
EVMPLLFARRRLDEARRQIQDLVQQKAAFAEEISQLKTANAHLRREVESVSGERNQAVSERDQLYERSTRAEAELAEARNLTENLAAAKDAAERENARAQAALEAGRYLRLSGIVAQAMELNRKGDKSRPTKSARSADQVAIQFTVQPNALVPTGTETFHIRVVPNAATGTTLGGDPSRTVTDKESGTEYPYTTAATCDYAQAEHPVSAIWNLGEHRLERGEYTVEVFNRGRKVGTTTFKVK